MKQRWSLWTYVAVCVATVVGSVLAGVVASLLSGNLSTELAAVMFVLVTLVSGFALYYRIKKRSM